MHSALVSADWLTENINDPSIVILGVSLKEKPHNSEKRYIEGTREVNLKKQFVDIHSTWPNAVPSPDVFEEHARALGINQDSKVVIYDWNGMYSSPRLWFLFMHMGHRTVYVLNGGIKSWMKQGFPTVETGFFEFLEGNFMSKKGVFQLIEYEEIKNGSFNILDARSKGRFLGLDPEPRKNLKSGSIPGSHSLPYSTLIDEEGGMDSKLISEHFEQFKRTEPLVFSCGSGITACILLLGAYQSGLRDLVLFDGSWTEWATKEGLVQ